ncbi:hypothetical protein [Hydrogenophaga sp. BPS33]|uniref:hypothetical protein n=1 Tax=Hydrogenophaga sp. BPS33 TaxID=2651974 RepID=UPI00131F7945|nr:hypothetical protein [Hydrogenophaga sp. BPS33]QHE84950.1 hypothetical protein F9K07_08655 [Hydrogenophaga sp. BPS33]
MKAVDVRRSVAPVARLPEHEKLGRLVARSLGWEAAALPAALKPAQLADLPDIVALRQEHLRGAWDDHAYLRWRYRLGRDSGGFGDLWYLRAQGQIMAIIGVEALRAELGAQSWSGAQVMDLLIRPEAQESGLGIWLNQAMLARHDFTLAVGANHNSAGIVRRMFEPLPPRLTFTHPLDLAPFVRRRWPAAAGLPLVMRMANGGLALRRLALRRHRPRGITVESATRLDPAMPVPSGQDADCVRLRRDSAYLQQRLMGNPRRGLSLRLARREGAVVGLIAWSIGADDRGRPELHVVDWHHDSDATLHALLHEAVREAAAQRCSCVRVTLQDHAAQRVAAQAGFLASHGDEGRLCGVQSRDPALARLLAQARWSLTDASDDGDAL